jgi:hypothetical protein
VVFYRTAEGKEHLKGSIQDVLDWYRDNDIAAEIRRRQSVHSKPRRPLPSPDASYSTGAQYAAQYLLCTVL